MNKISLVIFDMDGLLIDSERGMWIVNEKRAVEELGYEFSYDFARSLMGASLDISKLRFKIQYGDDFPVEKLYEIIHSYNREMIQNNKIKLMKGVLPLLDFLHSNNIKMRIATSTHRSEAEAILKGLNIYHYFERVVTGDEIKKGKPAPDIYLKALGSDKKEETLIFEDAHNGIRSGINAGINVILVPDLALLTEEDLNDAFKVLNQIDEAIPLIKEINNIM